MRTMIQYFEWDLEPDGKHYQNLMNDIENLVALRITDVWMPPASKGSAGGYDVGYSIYDLYDIGEFDQKGSVRTKYGTEEEYAQVINALNDAGIRVIADMVLNHKLGADETEVISVIEMDAQERNREVDRLEIEAWTTFNFEGRNDAYSQFKWHAEHFTAVDFDQRTGRNGIFQIEGKHWSDKVDLELENFDYLMGSDVDFSHPDVVQEYVNFGKWFINKYQIGGLRLDAVKHIDFDFFPHWLGELRNEKELFVVGEYWSPDLKALNNYLFETELTMNLFDVPFHMNMFDASHQRENYDLRDIFKNTLVLNNPDNAVTFVDNHDTQIGQSLESYVDEWFRYHANALVLLRPHGMPCVFLPDYLDETVRKLLALRSHLEEDYIDMFDDANVVGWTFNNDKGLSVLMSNHDASFKKMFVGKRHAGKVFKDALGHCGEEVTIDDLGIGMFKVEAMSVSAYTLNGEI